MVYQLDFWDAVKASFLPFSGLSLIMPLIALVMLLVPMLAALSVGGAGWQLNNGQLQITSYGTSTIAVAAAEVALVASTGPWRATWRLWGTGLPGASTGRFRFQNGKTATYFRHLGSPLSLVLRFGGRYYVLSHPGVEKLYEELIALGAQPAEL